MSVVPFTAAAPTTSQALPPTDRQLFIAIGDCRLTPAQWLGLMGCWRYCHRVRPNVLGPITASMAFDALVDKAAARGFADRRLLKAAMRTGRVGPKALERCQAVVQYLTPAELAREVAFSSQTLELLAPAQGWAR